MNVELKLHSLTSPTLHPPSLCGITSNITDIASTDITATTTQRLCGILPTCLDITDAASVIAAFDISLTPDITGKRLWHPLLTPTAAMGP
jgi:hypothetical protein